MRDASHGPSTSPSIGALAVMSAGCGITVGNVYFAQPLLHQISVTLGVPEQVAGYVAVAAQVGYALGILLILPLADAVDPRRLVRVLLLLTALSLAGAASSPGIWSLVAASFAVAATTVVPQVLIPVASGLVPPERRGRVIGTLQTGLVLGILLSRTVSGSLAEVTGSWRAPYVLAAGLTTGLAVVLPRLVPERTAVPHRPCYLQLLGSLLPLLTLGPLRLSMALGFCVFAAFSAFWATLSFHLGGPAFGLGPASAGLFGLYGALGAILAPMAGRLSDRVGTLVINAAALACVLVSFVLSGWLGASSLVALVVAVNLLDFGLQSGQVANQARIFALGDAIRGRLNTLYMVATFGGGAVGSLAGSLAFEHAGWTGVCCVSLALVCAGALVLFLSKRAVPAHDEGVRRHG